MTKRINKPFDIKKSSCFRGSFLFQPSLFSDVMPQKDTDCKGNKNSFIRQKSAADNKANDKATKNIPKTHLELMLSHINTSSDNHS